MELRFEFDAVNKILLARPEGRLTDESFAEVYGAIRKYSTATDARAGIFDLSSVTEFAISAETVRRLARQEPAMPDATARPRIIAVKSPKWIWSSPHVSDCGSGDPAPVGSRTYCGRGLGGTRHSIPTLRIFGVTHFFRRLPHDPSYDGCRRNQPGRVHAKPEQSNQAHAEHDQRCPVH